MERAAKGDELMATSQNGWTVHTSSARLVPLRWATGRVVAGDVHDIFDYLCERFDAEVEPIIRAHSWGWAYRAIRGQTSGYSNHASGTAIDLNAPAHPLGRRGTFTAAQVAAIRRILADLGGVVRWGGDYVNRADEMHFEINASAAQVAAVARRLRQSPTRGVTRFLEAKGVKQRRKLAQGLAKNGATAAIRRIAKNWLKHDAVIQRRRKRRARAYRNMRKHEVK